MRLKNIWQLLILLMSVFILQACSDDADPKVDASNIKITTSALNISEFEVTPENLGLEAINVSWEGDLQELNVKLKTTYVIQMDRVGNNFSHAKPLASTTEKSYSVKSIDLDKFLVNNFSQAYDTAEEYEIRVVAGVFGKDNVIAPLTETAMNSQSIKVTVIELKKDPLYIVGGALIGWGNDPANIGGDLQLLFGDNNDSDQKYTYTGHFKPGGFKLITKAGDWATAYGLEDGKLAFGKGGDIPGPETEGIYTLSVDLLNLTVELKPYAEVVTTNELVALRGTAAIDWDTDLPLTKVAEHVWVATNAELKVGEMKFKGDNSWWGTNGTIEFPFAQAAGDNNIKIENAGTYFIAFNDLTKHFVVIPMADLP